MRLWPPANTLASSPYSVSRLTASSTDVGALYSNSGGFIDVPLWLAGPQRSTSGQHAAVEEEGPAAHERRRVARQEQRGANQVFGLGQPADERAGAEIGDEGLALVWVARQDHLGGHRTGHEAVDAHALARPLLGHRRRPVHHG